MKTSHKLLLAGLLLAAFPAVAHEGHDHDTPGAATMFKVGALDVATLKDTQFILPNDNKVFGLGQTPAAVAEVLKAAGAPEDKITLSVDVLLIRDAGRVILIDSGIGPKGKGQLLDSLKKAGVAPAAVTDILITHSHGDHIGGLLDAEGKPAFPKATIRMSSPEWAALKGRSGAEALVTAMTPQVVAFEPGAQVLPSIRAVPIAGHTPGHTGYEITSGSAKLLAIGDASHSSIISLAKPDWGIQFDGDSPTATQSRRTLLTKLAREGTLIYSPHFPYPGVGRIEARGDGFVWKPTITAHQH